MKTSKDVREQDRRIEVLHNAPPAYRALHAMSMASLQ